MDFLAGEKLEKKLLREEKIDNLIGEAKAKQQNARSKKKKLEFLDWCLNTIEENNGDWEKLAVKAMEEIEEEKLMKEIAEMLEEEVKRIEEATCEDEQIKSIESIELLKTISPPLNTAPPQRPSTSTSSSTSRHSLQVVSEK